MKFENVLKYYDAESMGASFSSGKVMDLTNIYGYSFHARWTGTPTGNIITQASNDGSTWIDVTTQAAGGASGSFLFNVDGAHYRYVRLIYNRVASTGTLTVDYFGKGA